MSIRSINQIIEAAPKGQNERDRSYDAILAAPGAQDTQLSTRGFQACGSTIAKNVLDWREKHDLEHGSVTAGFFDVLNEVKKSFPEVQTPNAALQMRRWQRQQERRNKQKQD